MGLEDNLSGAPKKPEGDEAVPSKEEVEKIVNQAREGRTRAFTPDTFRLAIKYGIRDFTGVSIPIDTYSPSDEVTFTDIDLRDANVECCRFTYVHFGHAQLTGMRVAGSDFFHSHLEQSTIDSIRLKNGEESVEVSLMDKKTTVDNASLWEMPASHDVVGSCSACEDTNRDVLDRKMFSEYGRRGVMLFQEGKPIGYMKLKGTRSFLALRTVYTDTGEVLFWKGMVYALPSSATALLEQLSRPHSEKRGKWRRIDVETFVAYMRHNDYSARALPRNNMRFLEDSELYERMTQLVDRIEAGKEPMIELLPKEAKALKKAQEEAQKQD